MYDIMKVTSDSESELTLERKHLSTNSPRAQDSNHLFM